MASSSSSSSSCRKKKVEGATFVQDLREHFDEFMNASMDEHKECFKKTISKMLGMTIAVSKENQQSETPISPVISVLPLQTSTSK